MKRFFNEKEVTSTLVMDALVSGVKQIEEYSRLAEPKKVLHKLMHISRIPWQVMACMHGSGRQKPTCGGAFLWLCLFLRCLCIEAYSARQQHNP